MKSTGVFVALFVTADARCNVCRESSKGTRSLANPSQSWHMSGKTWTCAYLQETVNDVYPKEDKYQEQWCLRTQAVAEEYCTCNGPPSDDAGGNIHDMHPACDICKGQDLDFVPSTNAKILADTGGFGHQNCDGLYHAAAQGIFSGHSCSTVQANAGPTCCHVDFPVTRGAFENFAEKFGKAYNGPEHAAEHEQVYEANMKWAAEHTTAEVAFGENMFADLTTAQFRISAGLGFYKPERMGGLPHLGVHVHDGERLADSVDWTTEGAVTPVKNQGQCGSCWAFSTTGAMEGHWQIASSQLVSMSEQQLIDCSAKNAGCNGGDMGLAFDFARTVNVATESSYPYKGIGGSCKFSGTTAIPAGGVTGYQSVGHSSDDLKSALMKGPVSVAIEADQMAFQLYKGGVLESSSGFFKNCGTSLDHGVLAVGYTANAFKVKNSWGASWGENGYIQLSTNGNTCGIHSDATFPVVSASVSV